MSVLWLWPAVAGAACHERPEGVFRIESDTLFGVGVWCILFSAVVLMLSFCCLLCVILFFYIQFIFHNICVAENSICPCLCQCSCTHLKHVKCVNNTLHLRNKWNGTHLEWNVYYCMINMWWLSVRHLSPRGRSHTNSSTSCRQASTSSLFI